MEKPAFFLTRVWLLKAADKKMHPIRGVSIMGEGHGAKLGMTLHTFITWLDATSQIFSTLQRWMIMTGARDGHLPHI